MKKNGMLVARSIYHRYLDKDTEFDNPFALRVFEELPGAVERFKHFYGEDQRVEFETGAVDITFFSDGEVIGESRNSVRGRDAFLIHDYKGKEGQFHANHGLMAHLAAVDGLYRAGAEKIYAIEPFFPYGRQERKDKPRRPITAVMVAEMLSKNVYTFVTADMHTDALEGYFKCPVVNIKALPLFVEEFRNKKGIYVPVSPDAGGFERAKDMGALLRSPEVSVIHKRTLEDNEKEALLLTGNVRDRDCIIVDDMFDTGGTLVKAAGMLKERGARKVYTACTHALNSPFERNNDNFRRAADRIMGSEIEMVHVTDSIPLGDDFFREYGEKFNELSMSKVFANIIVRLYAPGSISKHLKDYYTLSEDY